MEIKRDFKVNTTRNNFIGVARNNNNIDVTRSSFIGTARNNNNNDITRSNNINISRNFNNNNITRNNFIGAARNNRNGITGNNNINTTNNFNDTKIDDNELLEKVEETTHIITFSSERFTFSVSSEDESIDCIDKAGSMFIEFKKKPPTLKEALEFMGYGERTEGLLKIFAEKALERLDELEAPELDVEDVAAIFCYTYEWDDKKFGNDIDSPYRKLNESISIDRSNPALRKTRAFLFLLLQALRKLPRYTPENRTLYRGIRVHVQTEADPERPDRKPYVAGTDKTWWTFASTTEDLSVARRFVEENKGTLFTLSGEAWGYDISVFSNYPDEKEVLLEPERKFSIKGVLREGAIIAVNAEILGTPVVLRDYIKVKPVKIKERKSKFKDVPRNLRVESITESTATLLWDAPEISGEEVLLYQVSVRQTSDRFINRNPESTYIVEKDEKEETAKYTVRDLEEGKKYEFRVRCKYGDGWGQRWCEKIVLDVGFGSCVWKECPASVDMSRKYTVDKKVPRLAAKIDTYGYCAILGNATIPLSTTTEWSVKILKSEDNDGKDMLIGIAPSDIDQNSSNHKCGWFFNCYDSTLNSGPPHNYSGKEYGPRKEKDGEYVHDGDTIGVVMDTIKGDLSFILDGVNHDVAFERIPLDKPLVPCVLLYCNGDSVELGIYEKEEAIDSFIPLIYNPTAKSTAWDTITLAWDDISGASFYQVEVDGNKLQKEIAANTFTKRGFLPDTEHSFRVRTVKGSSVCEWSDVVKERTLKAPEFSECMWKKCTKCVIDSKKYGVHEKNHRIATKINTYSDCTIIGNTLIPFNTVATWGVKILKSRDNKGNDVYIGVAPSDIDQNENDNYNKCGWYFNCYNSVLWSGPPHNYRKKAYGPRKEGGEYVFTGDGVGVMMDTTKGDLSFILNGMNLGVAFERIPLDKPLVPCVLLGLEGYSVGLII